MTGLNRDKLMPQIQEIVLDMRRIECLSNILEVLLVYDQDNVKQGDCETLSSILCLLIKDTHKKIKALGQYIEFDKG